MLPTKITVLGAGSASFGLHTIADLGATAAACFGLELRSTTVGRDLGDDLAAR